MHWINFRVRVLYLGMLVLWGCHSKDYETEKIIQEWNGKNIKFPSQLESKILGKDTTATVADLLNKEYCVLTFIDSTGCTECSMKLRDWYLKMKEISGQDDKVDFVFIVHTKNFAAVSAFAIKNKFNHLLFYDTDRQFWKLNKDLPQRTDLQTFLLNRKHDVLLVGNPLGREVLWELYKKQIETLEYDSGNS